MPHNMAMYSQYGTRIHNVVHNMIFAFGIFFFFLYFLTIDYEIHWHPPHMAHSAEVLNEMPRCHLRELDHNT